MRQSIYVTMEQRSQCVRFKKDDVTLYKQLNENWEGRWIVWGMWIESKWWKCTKWKRVVICKIDNYICINQSFNVSYYILLFLYLSYYFALEKMLCKIIFCDHILHYEYRVNFAYNAEIYMDINRYKFHPWCIWWSLWCSELFCIVMGARIWTASGWCRITKPLPNN